MQLTHKFKAKQTIKSPTDKITEFELPDEGGSVEGTVG